MTEGLHSRLKRTTSTSGAASNPDFDRPTDPFARIALLVDGPLPGALNMGRDEELLEAAIRGDLTLRFYQWSRPTVSLGHFQASSGMSLPERFSGLDVVRRLSGGGAILHDRELTYSCGLPARHPLAEHPSSLYDLLHAAIVSTLGSLGVACEMRGGETRKESSFLCFSRGDPRDIIARGEKIVGSAQRRRQGAVLQHGSILLAASQHTPEIPGIRELTGVALTPDQLVPHLSHEMQQALCQ